MQTEDDDLRTRAQIQLTTRPDEVEGDWNTYKVKLYQYRLAPVEPHLAGHDNSPPVKHLIILPSNWMSRLPVETLTDKYTVSYAPSGTMFAWLQEQRAKRFQPRPRALLALGDYHGAARHFWDEVNHLSIL